MNPVGQVATSLEQVATPEVGPTFEWENQVRSALGEELAMTNLAFNPLLAIPRTNEEIEKQRIIDNLGVLDLGLDATPEQYAEHAKAFEGASINVLMEAQGNRERKAVLVHSADGGFEIDYVRPEGERMQMLDLTEEDINAIGADLGWKSEGITRFKMEKKTEEIMEQNRLITEVEQEFQKYNMLDLPAAQQTIEAQRQLLNELVDEYDELYKQYEEYDNE